MYSLDINFLNDRTERATDGGITASRGAQESTRPLYLGVGVGLFLPVLMLGLWFLFQQRNAALQRRQAELDNQLTALQAQLQEVESINTRINQLNTDNRALAAVFEQIKPWSALLQDIRDRVPAGIQIANIVQQTAAPQAPAAPATPPSPPADPNAPAGQPPAAPVPVSQVQIEGQARSFNDVNDFLLTLQRSPFLEADSLRLVSAELVDNPTRIDFPEDEGGQDGVTVQLPQVVDYTISGNLTNLPTSQLMEELERTLSVGLVTRIQTLRDKGVIQP